MSPCSAPRSRRSPSREIPSPYRISTSASRNGAATLFFTTLISREGDLLDLGAEQGVIEKSGSWFSFQGERMAQGRDNSRIFLREHPQIRDRIVSAVRQKIGLAKPETALPKASAAQPAGAIAQSA